MEQYNLSVKPHESRVFYIPEVNLFKHEIKKYRQEKVPLFKSHNTHFTLYCDDNLS